jgi:YggT family protein
MNILIISSVTLGILFFIMTLLFISRIVFTWYPNINLSEFPYKLAYLPTEPFLIPTRKIIPPLGGIDITPIIWLGIFSLLREVLLGQQGLVTLVIRHSS